MTTYRKKDKTEQIIAYIKEIERSHAPGSETELWGAMLNNFVETHKNGYDLFFEIFDNGKTDIPGDVIATLDWWHNAYRQYAGGDIEAVEDFEI